MAWTYSGNPNSSELDQFRFLIGDTMADEPILTDEEIQFVLTSTGGLEYRLIKLFEAVCLFFVRDAEKTLGPLKEVPQKRYEHAKESLDHYRKLVSAGSGISAPSYASSKIFSKGMHSNV